MKVRETDLAKREVISNWKHSKTRRVDDNMIEMDVGGPNLTYSSM